MSILRKTSNNELKEKEFRVDTSKNSKASKALNRLLNEDVDSVLRGFEG